MFTWVDVCSTQPLCRGIQSAFRRVTHQRPRRRVYFGPYRNNPDNNGMDQIVTLPYSVMCPRDCSVRDFRINSHRRPLVRPGDVHACGTEIRRPQTHPHTHPFNGPFSRTTRVSRYQKGKPIWILLKQETVSNSGISWAICKSAPCTRQITTPAPHHSVFYRPDALPAAQPTASKHRRRQTTVSVHNYIRGVCVCVCVCALCRRT